MPTARTYVRRSTDGLCVHNGYAPSRPHRLAIVTGGYTSKGYRYFVWDAARVVGGHEGDDARRRAVEQARTLVTGRA